MAAMTTPTTTRDNIAGSMIHSSGLFLLLFVSLETLENVEGGFAVGLQ